MKRILMVVLAVLLLGPLSAQAQDPFGLGAADPANFTLLEIGSSSTLDFSAATVTGNVGLAGTGSTFENGTGSISGQLVVQDGDTVGKGAVSIKGGTQIGGTVTLNGQSSNTDSLLNSAITDANNVSTTYANDSATNTSITSINLTTGSQTITGTSGINILKVSNFNVGSGATLTFQAPSTGSFVIDDTGNFTLDGSVTESGIGANDLLINVLGTGNELTTNITSSPGTFGGIVLAPERSAHWDLGTYNSEIIVGGSSFSLLSNPTVNGIAPEAPFVQLGTLLALMAVSGVRRRRKNLTPSPSPAGEGS